MPSGLIRFKTDFLSSKCFINYSICLVVFPPFPPVFLLFVAIISKIHSPWYMRFMTFILDIIRLFFVAEFPFLAVLNMYLVFLLK